MPMRISTPSTDPIDGATSRQICGAIGERLRRNMRPETSDLPPTLSRLLDELRRQDDNQNYDGAQRA